MYCVKILKRYSEWGVYPKALNAVFPVAVKMLLARFQQGKSGQLASKLAVAKDGLIYAKNITKNIKKRLKRRKRLNSGDIKEYKG